MQGGGRAIRVRRRRGRKGRENMEFIKLQLIHFHVFCNWMVVTVCSQAMRVRKRREGRGRRDCKTWNVFGWLPLLIHFPVSLQR